MPGLPVQGRGGRLHDVQLLNKIKRLPRSTPVNEQTQFASDLCVQSSSYRTRLQSTRVKEYFRLLATKCTDLLAGVKDGLNENELLRDAQKSWIKVQFEELEKVKRNLNNNGYLYFHEPIAAIWAFIQNVEKVVGESYHVILDCKLFLEECSNDEDIKRDLNMCCFQPRLNPSHPVACNADECQYLIERSAENYRCAISQDITFHVCASCYKKSRDTITVKTKTAYMPGTQQCNEIKERVMSKKEFIRASLSVGANNEDTVTCAYCIAPFHTMCVNFDPFNWEVAYSQKCKQFKGNFNAKYVCPSCSRQISQSQNIHNNGHNHQFNQLFGPGPNSDCMQTQIFSAQSMFKTKLANYVESTLLRYLSDKCIDKGLPLPDPIIVREIHKMKKLFKVKPLMKKKYEEAKMATEYPYIERSLMVYQVNRATGKEIAIFNIILQEYESIEYFSISYLDSVRLFEPAVLRSDFYQKIVVACMHGMHLMNPKLRPSGKTMDQDMLIKWYQEVMKMGIVGTTIDVFRQVGKTDNPYDGYILQIPYMADDYWPDKLEELIGAYNEELEKYNKRMSGEIVVEPEEPPRKRRKSVKKCDKECQVPITVEERVNQLVMDEVQESMFTVTLKELEDEDDPNIRASKVRDRKMFLDNAADEPHVRCRFMGNRDNFLLACREMQFDFSDHRRAAHTTMYMHSQMAKESLQDTRCFHCRRNITKGFYCFLCNDDTCNVYCVDGMCTGTHVHQHGWNKFVVPFDRVPPVDPKFGNILNQLYDEGNYLKSLFDLHACPDLATHINNNMRMDMTYQHEILLWHKDKLKRSDNSAHHIAKCVPCNVIWTLLPRHREFCKGLTCSIPSCSVNPIPTLKLIMPLVPNVTFDPPPPPPSKEVASMPQLELINGARTSMHAQTRPGTAVVRMDIPGIPLLGKNSATTDVVRANGLDLTEEPADKGSNEADQADDPPPVMDKFAPAETSEETSQEQD